MRTIILLSTILCFLGSDGIAQAEENVSEAIKLVVMENLSAPQAENTDRIMRTIHTQSPGYLQTKQQIAPLFDNFDLSYELLSFSYIGQAGEYALARVGQATKKISGLTFSLWPCSLDGRTAKAAIGGLCCRPAGNRPRITH